MNTLVDSKKEGLLELVGWRVTFFCMNYIYTGTLAEINERDVKLEKAVIVYETGGFFDKEWKDARPLPNDLYVNLSSVESYTVIR